MANIKPRVPMNRWSALIAAAVMALPMAMAPNASATDLAQREAQRRSQDVHEAMELLRKGDEAYLDTDYHSAVEAFAGARELIPNAPASMELHRAATERFVTASVEHARVLARHGDVPAAITAVDRVLAPDVAPDHPAARRMLADLNDPIRTNPALTKGHAADVDQVRRGLYTAEGAFNLGKFDEAMRHYESVLRIDPHNRAARRGMERVAARKVSHHRAAYDHTRAEMLSEVDAQWETQPPMVDEIPEQEAGLLRRAGEPAFIPVANKINRIIIPTYRIEQASLLEAIDLLRARARENDTLETDPAQRGININVIAGDAAGDIFNRRIDLQLQNTSVAAILRYLCDLTGTNFAMDDHSVIIRPLAAHRDEIVTRTFRVPPDFLGSISAGSSAGAEPEDPFAPRPQTGLLPQRLGIREALEANGLQFIEGASASLSNNLLRVTHTPAAMELVEQLVNAVADTEPVSVITRVTIMRVQETKLTELGYDWLLGNFKIGGGGGDFLGVSGGTEGSVGSLSDLDPILIGPMNPITAGNRSGTEAINPNVFVTGIARSDSLGRDGTARAPGILSISGVMNNTTAQMVMRGLDQNQGVDIMQQPSVVTRNGQAASVRVVREFIYPTEYEPPQVPQNVGSTSTAFFDEDGGFGEFGGGSPNQIVTPATPTAFEMRETGMILEVLPQADATRNYVDITIAPVLTDLDGFINYGTPINSITTNPITGTSRTREITPNAILQPIFSVSRLNTQVTVADGATIVLGGLLSSRMEDVEDQTPILGDIPIIGRFFQTKASQPVRTAVLFFVNVELIDPTGRPYRDR